VLDRRGELAWDIYFLYGPDSHWGVAPSDLLGSASPVIASLDTLKQKLTRA
jgi:hypothetical protein